MCGIAGSINFDGPLLSDEGLDLLSKNLHHRGPDARGKVHVHGAGSHCQLIHSRLSIIDLSEGGNQPMVSHSENTWIAFNGEIYNYLELKKELATYPFRSNSDTEVILAAYEAWGLQKTLQKLDGMFALALFDKRTGELHLARDPFGKKPLLYAQHEKGWIFHSDVRTLKTMLGDVSVNQAALGYYFTELATPGNDTIWEGIHKLSPGSWVTISTSGMTYHTYWSPVYATDNSIEYHTALDRTEELLKKSVAKRLIADVNVSALLSGGIDSSLMVALMSEVSGKAIDTYTVGFTQKEYSEAPYARAVAEHFGTRHHELLMKPEELMDLDFLIEEAGEPFADPSMIPSFYVYKGISEKEKVAIGGDGGDELFGGYYVYYFAKRLQETSNWVGLLSPFSQLLLSKSGKWHFLGTLAEAKKEEPWKLLHRGLGLSPEELRLLSESTEVQGGLFQNLEKVWKGIEGASQGYFNKVLHGSLLTRLLSSYLVKVDRMSMANSLEVRSPLLDKSLAEFAFSLSPEVLLKGNQPKAILRDLAKRYIPEDIADRPKHGFGVPLDDWFRGPLKKRFEEVVFSQQNLVPLDYTFIRVLFDRHLNGENLGGKLWTLYVFHHWAHRT